MLTGVDTEEQIVEAFEAGTDDYLIKPFGAAELLARVRAHLRRSFRAGATGMTVFEFGNVRVDLGKRIVEKDGQQIHLTPIEFRLLAYLIANPDSVLTHRQLLEAVWGPFHVEDSHYVRVDMGHVRKKSEDDPTRPKFILTESGVGYRFVS